MSQTPTRRLAWISLVVCALVVAYLVYGATAHSAPAGNTDAARASSCAKLVATNSYAQDVVVTTSDASFYTSAAWTNLACGTGVVTVPRGRRALVVVKVDAEVVCVGAAGQWCLGRVLVGGVEAAPRAPEPDSFAWAHSESSASAWESNAFTRSAALSCPVRTALLPPCQVPYVVQVRTHTGDLSLRVDDSTVHASLTYY